jgi:hypothetical protein
VTTILGLVSFSRHSSCRTPEKLYDLVSSILVAYFTGAKASTMLKEAAALMRPKVIDRIKLLKDMIQKDFL